MYGQKVMSVFYYFRESTTEGDVVDGSNKTLELEDPSSWGGRSRKSEHPIGKRRGS